jgi:hypothetical protein
VLKKAISASRAIAEFKGVAESMTFLTFCGQLNQFF